MDTLCLNLSEELLTKTTGGYPVFKTVKGAAKTNYWWSPYA
jgi:hypothetical protein